MTMRLEEPDFIVEEEPSSPRTPDAILHEITDLMAMSNLSLEASEGSESASLMEPAHGEHLVELFQEFAQTAEVSGQDVMEEDLDEVEIYMDRICDLDKRQKDILNGDHYVEMSFLVSRLKRIRTRMAVGKTLKH